MKSLISFIIFLSFNRLRNKILSIPYEPGLTRTDRALHLANSDLFSEKGGARENTGKLLLVLTDGVTNEGSENYTTVLAPLKVLDPDYFSRSFLVWVRAHAFFSAFGRPGRAGVSRLLL